MLVKRALILSALALFCFCGVLFLDRTQPLAYVQVQNLYRDAVSRAGRLTAQNQDLVFLAIDSDSISLDQTDLNQLFGGIDPNSKEGHALRLMSQSWPWSREIYALILDRILSAGAKAVAFDLLFPTASENDEPFRLALDKYREHVIIGSNFVDRSFSRPTDTLVPATVPMDNRVAFTNFWSDNDGVVRRARYHVTLAEAAEATPMPGSEKFLSLAARALIKAGFAETVPTDQSDCVLRFTAPPRQGFPARSIFEIFVPEYWKHNYQSGQFFRDKIVVIGSEGNWQHDEQPTPFGLMPGAELHLNAINAALHHEFIRGLHPGIETALTLMAGIIGIALSLIIRQPWLRLGVLITTCGAAFAFALFLFNHVSIYVPLIAPITELNVTVLFGLISDLTSERFSKARIRRTLERYVSRNIVREIIDSREPFAQSLGGVTKQVTILFSDLRGYSAMAARRGPEELLAQLNEYFSAMVECVFQFGGTLDKFIGDAVMAVWGNLHSNGPRQDAIAAVRAAMAMRTELAKLNEKWRDIGWPQLRAGTAINHGKVVVGNIGSPQRMEFGVIGEPVNLCWKLQELTKSLGTDLIISAEVRSLVNKDFDLQPLGQGIIPNLDNPIEIFTVGARLELDRKTLSQLAGV